MLKTSLKNSDRHDIEYEAQKYTRFDPVVSVEN